MKFIKFKACNIFSLGEVELDLENRGLTLVTGYSYDEGDRNGSGKSSLTSKGILWTLYGKTPSGIRADAVINRHAVGNKIKSFGVVTIRVGSSLFNIVRGRNPKGLRLYQHSDILSNESDLSFKDERSTQHEIDTLVGYTFEEFTRMFFFGQGLSEVFIDQPQAFKKSLIEKILPFETIDEIAEKTKKVSDNYSVYLSSLINNRQIISNTWNNLNSDIYKLKRQRDSEAATLAKYQGQSFDLPDFNTLNELDQYEKIERSRLKGLKQKQSKATNTVCPMCKNSYIIPGEFSDKERDEIVKIEAALSKVPIKKQLIEICNLNKERWNDLIKEKEELLLEAHRDNEKLTNLISDSNKKEVEVKHWYTALKNDIRNSLLDTACPMLTDYTNGFLRKLKNEQITVNFKVNGADFDIDVASKTGGATFDSLSGGEQQMVNFAVGLSLGSLSKHIKGDAFVPSLMIFDEPFTQLDDRNAEAVVEFLTTNDMADTILLVSNDPTLMSLIPNVIKVTKRNGVSTLD